MPIHFSLFVDSFQKGSLLTLITLPVLTPEVPPLWIISLFPTLFLSPLLRIIAHRILVQFSRQSRVPLSGVLVTPRCYSMPGVVWYSNDRMVAGLGLLPGTAPNAPWYSTK